MDSIVVKTIVLMVLVSAIVIGIYNVLTDDRDVEYLNSDENDDDEDDYDIITYAEDRKQAWYEEQQELNHDND